MNRSISLQQIPTTKHLLHSTRSLPNIEIINTMPKRLVGIKRQNSKRGKIQKTWDKVKTIIYFNNPSTKSNSNKTNACTEFESTRNVSPSRKSSKCQLLPTTSVPPTLSSNFDVAKNSKSLFEDEDLVVKNYEKLQKRLSDELHLSIKEDKKREEILPEDLKRRLQEWKMWNVSTGKHHYTRDELQKLIPTEFSKKLQEWEDIKTRSRDVTHPSVINCTSKKCPQKITDESCKQRQLIWLEKQLEKVELEKKRLEREMKKYCEREARLKNLREALKNNPDPRQEIWIKTPTAECKVEGINEKFAKKLFKWEEKQGIEPESSTMSLLNPKYYTPTPDALCIDLEANEINPSDDGGEHEGNTKRSTQFTSSDESEVDGDYEEARNSATTDEALCASSNTDSGCINLIQQPPFRRSSDSLSTSLSSWLPSLLGCTLDVEDKPLLKTISENEQERDVCKAKPILVGDDGNIGELSSSIIVQTKRMLFAPVIGQVNEFRHCDNKTVLIESMKESDFVRNVTHKSSEPTWRRPEPPKVVGVVRKGSSYDFPGPIPMPVSYKKTQTYSKISEKYHPLKPRREFVQNTDLTIDEFLQHTLISNSPPHHSKIPIKSPLIKRKYTIDIVGGISPKLEDKRKLRNLTRSSSFQGNRHISETPLQFSRPPLPPCQIPQSVVTKSKSTGSILRSDATAK